MKRISTLLGRISGDIGAEITGERRADVVSALQAAYCDEWMAFHQYVSGALVAEGMFRPEVEKELEEHAEDEKRHAEMIAERLVQLGAVPVMNPSDWTKYGRCGFKAPDSGNTESLLSDNVRAEQCAIKFYSGMLGILSGDPVTEDMIRDILEDEVEHEEDLQNVQRDIRITQE